MMFNEYDRSLHGGPRLKTMESEPQEFDEAKTDAAIADILRTEAAKTVPVAQIEKFLRPEFPVLQSQEQVDQQATARDAGLSRALKQKWAELSGAA